MNIAVNRCWASCPSKVIVLSRELFFVRFLECFRQSPSTDQCYSILGLEKYFYLPFFLLCSSSDNVLPTALSILQVFGGRPCRSPNKDENFLEFGLKVDKWRPLKDQSHVNSGGIEILILVAQRIESQVLSCWPNCK